MSGIRWRKLCYFHYTAEIDSKAVDLWGHGSDWVVAVDGVRKVEIGSTTQVSPLDAQAMAEGAMVSDVCDI